MQPAIASIDNASQLRSLDPKAVNSLALFNSSDPHPATLSTKRSTTEGDYHQRSYSSAMGPMGANENHGPIRPKAVQDNSTHSFDRLEYDGRTSYRDPNRPMSHQSRHSHTDDHEEDELEEDIAMDNEEHEREGETDEENVDELMDEDELEEGNGSGSSHGRSKYSRTDHQAPRGASHHQQHPPHGARALPNILPRPGGDGYGPDGPGPDDQRNVSSWDTASDLPRTGAPRNNRPLQVRTLSMSDAGGASSAEYSNNSPSSGHPGGSLNEASNGTAADANGNGNFSNTAVGVNNGSSKKRTTPAKHKCPQCDKYFTRPFNLKSHQRTHTQERPFVCSFAHCARAFSRLHDCNRHMRTHWRIKPYSCPECHRNFVRQDALTRHLRLDFGHNRCSGFPGPLPGGSSNQDKSEDSDDGVEDSPTEANLNMFSSSVSAESISATTQAGPPYTSPTSPTSSSKSSPVGHGQEQAQGHLHVKTMTGSRLDSKHDTEVERSSMSGPASAPPLSGPPSRDPRMSQMAVPAPESVHQPVPEHKDDREPPVRRDSGPQSRYPPGTGAPISFVHRSTPVDRRAVTPPNSKEGPAFLSQHGRSFSHSFNHGQPVLPVTSSPMSAPLPSVPPPSNGVPNQERRGPPSHGRNGGPWSAPVHEPPTAPAEYYQGPPHSRPSPSGHAVARPEASDFERMRPFAHPHPQSEYPPPSPSEARRASPPNHPPDWNGPGQDGARPWGWDQPRPAEGRHRHPSWSGSPIRGPGPVQPHDQPAHAPMPPSRASTMDSWPRGAPPPPLAREEQAPRDSRGPVRASQRPSSEYPTSPYPVDPNVDNHSPRSMPGAPPSMGRPVESFQRQDVERDPRQRSMTDIDRGRGPAGGWTEQRSRSFHDLDTGVGSRPRFEQQQHSHSPQQVREVGSISRGPGPDAALPERSHVYSGMVATERHVQQGPYPDREHFRESAPNSAPIKEPMVRDYRPSRSQSTMDYDTDRDGYHRQSRYGGEPNAREARRSMSPQRSATMEGGRPYDRSPRYAHPNERPESYGREDAERMTGRPFRHEERLVMSPVPREEPGPGYFGGGESFRPNQGGGGPHIYPPGPQAYAPYRPTEAPYPHPDVHQEHGHRERHSIDMPMASPTTPVGGPPPMSRRSLSSATVSSR